MLMMLGDALNAKMGTMQMMKQDSVWLAQTLLNIVLHAMIGTYVLHVMMDTWPLRWEIDARTNSAIVSLSSQRSCSRFPFQLMILLMDGLITQSITVLNVIAGIHLIGRLSIVPNVVKLFLDVFSVKTMGHVELVMTDSGIPMIELNASFNLQTVIKIQVIML